jgi:AcrR family transcriptional regulator
MTTVPEDDEAAPASRRRILDAAARLMSERGYAGTSISMISRESGLPASSIYWHFGSKERLLNEILERAAARMVDSIPSPDQQTGAPARRLLEMLRAGSAGAESEAAAGLRLLAMITLERRPGRAGPPSAVRRLRRQVRQAWERVFRETIGDNESDGGATALATFAMAVTDGLFFASQVDPDLDAAGLGQIAATALLAAAESQLAQATDAA